MPDGSADLRQAVDELALGLPEPLRPIAELAYNYWWSWAPGGEALFASIHERGWELASHDPVRLLQDTSAPTLGRAAEDPGLIAAMRDLTERLRGELEAPPADAPLVAFFCMEYAIHSSLPIFAGGLGVLGGDLLKEASDRRVPFVGVGLLYRHGYMHQRLDTSGWQHEHWTVVYPERLPAVRVRGDDGEPLTVTVGIRDRTVAAHVWRVDVGRSRLYLLDAEHPANHPVDRWITSRLYVTDRDVRLAQYVLLGTGGVRALRAMGIEPGVLHLNEGHAVFAAAEIARSAADDGGDIDDALREVRSRTIFTTHTPVAAGNESFGVADVLATAAELRESSVPVTQRVIGLGSADGSVFGLTEFGLRVSRFRNGVSRLHGEVAREMWRHLDEPHDGSGIRHVTNGVHIPTWMAPPMQDLMSRHLGPDWIRRADDPSLWAKVDDIPDEEIWEIRNILRSELIAFARQRAIRDRLGRGEPLTYAEAAHDAFDLGRLTIGFARRAAAYKRLHLLTLDPDRGLGFLREPKSIQVFLAGKAHPADDEAKSIVRGLFGLKAAPEVGDHVAYLEDYDLAVASMLVSGCDIWLNLPRPPLEASGTSGMKAAMNGGLNLSVSDGWWAEAEDGSNGWTIHSDPEGGADAQDERDAAKLYELLENEVIPAFYERDGAGVPREWVRRVKASLRTVGPAFNATRMLNDYLSSAYRPG